MQWLENGTATVRVTLWPQRYVFYAHLFSGLTISPVFFSPGKQPLAPAVTRNTGGVVFAFFNGGELDISKSSIYILNFNNFRK